MDYSLGIAQPAAIYYKCISDVCTRLPEARDVFCHDACLRYAHGVDLLLTRSNLQDVLRDVTLDAGGRMTQVKRSDLDLTQSRGDVYYDDDDDVMSRRKCANFCRENSRVSFSRCLMLLCKNDASGVRRAREWESGANQDGGGGISAEKRWASRMSCAEAQCSNFAGAPQQFYDCSVQNCA